VEPARCTPTYIGAVHRGSVATGWSSEADSRDRSVRRDGRAHAARGSVDPRVPARARGCRIRVAGSHLCRSSPLSSGDDSSSCSANSCAGVVHLWTAAEPIAAGLLAAVEAVHADRVGLPTTITSSPSRATRCVDDQPVSVVPHIDAAALGPRRLHTRATRRQLER